MLVFRSIHVPAHFVGGGPKLSLKPKGQSHSSPDSSPLPYRLWPTLIKDGLAKTRLPAKRAERQPPLFASFFLYKKHLASQQPFTTVLYPFSWRTASVRASNHLCITTNS
jgi:hypothetical protein